MAKLLNVLGWIGTVLVFVAVAVRLLGWAGVIPVSTDTDRLAIYAAWSGLGLVVLYTLGQWRDIVAYFRQRNARYGAIASISVLAVLGILIAVNYLSTRQNKRWDLTANQQFSLSEQTTKLLEGLQAPVKFLVFEQEPQFARFRARLDEYAYHSKQVSIEYIDPDRRPVQAKQYEIQSYGTVVVEYMGRTERVTTDNEQDLTNALIKVLNPQQKKVYFLSGHGEKDPAGTDRLGYNAISDALRRDNYQFDKLVLAQTNEIPADASVLVIAGPRTDLLEQETPLIKSYLDKQGKLLVLLDPSEDLKTPAPLPRLTALLAEWGINATSSVIVDLSGRTSVATVPVAGPPYPSHPITDRFELITAFPLARAVLPATNPPPGRTPQAFVQTAQRSWAEATPSQLETPESLAPEPEKGDTPGPVSVAVAVSVPGPAPDPAPAANTQGGEEPRRPETRVAVFGDSDFASNAYAGTEGNRDLFMNTVGWLAQQENLIAIRAREPADRRITLTEVGRTTMGWLSLLIVPAAVFTAGIYSWWRRR